MRKALAGAILGPSLLVATLAWSAFAILHTVLDPDRSERIADVLLDDETVRAEMAASIGAGVRRSLPEEASAFVSDEQLEAGATIALDDPVVEGLIRAALVQSHQAFLGEAEPPRDLDIGAATGAVRTAIVGQTPQLDGILPDTPEMVIDLPTDNLPNIGFLRRWLQRFYPIAGALAAAGVALALFTTNDRPKILRRAGYWAITASLFWLLAVFGVPWVFSQYFSGQAAISKALVEAFFGEMRPPSLTLAGAGAAAILVSFFWRLAGRRSPRAAPQPAPARARVTAPAPRRPVGPPPVVRPPAPRAPTSSPTRTMPRAAPPPASAQPRAAAPPTAVPPKAVPSTSPSTSPSTTPSTTPSTSSAPAPARVEPPLGPIPDTRRTRWVEGVGYVDINASPPPSNPTTPPHLDDDSVANLEGARSPAARWKPGVGYVDEDE